MATAKKAADTAIDPAATYQVTLNKSIKVGRAWLRPSSERVRVSGAVLSTILESVDGYDRVA